MDWFKMLHLILFLLLSSSYSSTSQFSPPSPSPSPSPSLPSCQFEDSFALLQFKNSFSIDESSDLYGACDVSPTVSWENGTDCCTAWNGITCNNITGHVVGLNISCGMLRGTIHSNSSLFLLRHLRSLVLTWNDFRGSKIPTEFGRFVDLVHLEISYSSFSGKLPEEISYLSKLLTVDIYYTGELTIDKSTLRRLATNLTKLQKLSLIQFDMSSVEPILLMNLSSSLTALDLTDCGLNGNFPESIFQRPNIQEVSIGYNENLAGSLPQSNWSNSLKMLTLSWTKIPIDFHILTKISMSLESLFLHSCKIIGWNPSLLANLTLLSSLNLSFNNLTGHIPWLSLNLKSLKFLDLSENYFTGQLPEIYDHNSTQIFVPSDHSSANQSVAPIPFHLESLYLIGNLLNGTIPHWLYSLPSLKFLRLSDNQFTGYINDFQYPSLVLLDLANNNLQGPIPKSIFQRENLLLLDLSSNNLTDVVGLYEFSKLKHLFYLGLSFNNVSLNSNIFLNGTLPKLAWVFLSSCNISEFPNFLRDSERLTFLDLSNNKIGGSVPSWMWDLGRDTLYYLNLSQNSLTNMEKLPWTSLAYLDLHFNLLQGHLPIPPPSLLVFSASNNQFTGGIPELICNSISLQVLDLSNNSLTGKIPPCIGNFSYSLSVLNFGMNKLHGMIPQTFSKGNPLRNLNLNGNQLEGMLPPSLLDCTSLEVLDVRNNRINETFPYWLESLPVLQVLVLRSNRFYGSIGSPRTAFPFQKLRIMDVSNNEFSGIMPEKYFENLIAMTNITYADKLNYMGKDFMFSINNYAGEYYYHDSVLMTLKGSSVQMEKIQTIFTTIDFSNNFFEGEIPQVIGKLKSLKGLNFSHNRLNGSIPSSLENLSNLEWLDLSSNELVGEIPQQLTDITSLSVLNFSHNRLFGPIPRGKQFDTFENSSYIGNLGLCGVPMSKTCSNDKAPQASPKDFQHEGNNTEKLNIYDWKFVLMGYGCGLVFGLSMGSVLLWDKEIVLPIFPPRLAFWRRA